MLSFNSSIKVLRYLLLILYFLLSWGKLLKSSLEKDHENGAEAVEVFGVAIEGIKSIFQYQICFY